MTNNIFKQLRITGFLLYIPLILLTGPLAGFIVGDFFSQKFDLGNYPLLTGLIAGIALSISETVRTIRLVLRIDKKN
ncbi:MAG TPA: hypothetical protein PLU24_03210 [Candidatus Omnitrophota bacterium]|nr:hypothetical protein [Candidatus Omnitrophota bacterium]